VLRDRPDPMAALIRSRSPLNQELALRFPI
jgi:hypothetical protein